MPLQGYWVTGYWVVGYWVIYWVTGYWVITQYRPNAVLALKFDSLLYSLARGVFSGLDFRFFPTCIAWVGV